MQVPHVCIESDDVPLSAATEAEVRRRLRRMEAGHPAVLEWRIHLQLLGVPGSQLSRVIATASARNASGVVLAHAVQRDVPDAVRVALGDLDEKLEIGETAGRTRVAAWLHSVKRHLG